MIRLVLFEVVWIFFQVVLIAVAYGYLLKLHKLVIMGVLAITGAVIPFFRELPQDIRVIGPLTCLAASLIYLFFSAEGIVNEPILDRKTAFLRAGMMALSTLGTDKKIYRTFFEKEEYDENGYRISKCQLPNGFERRCEIVEGSHVEIYSPEKANEKVVFMFPGGGFAGRFTDFKMSYTWDYSKALHGARVIVLDYLTTLDGIRCPHPLKEAVKVYQWILKKGVRPENIIIAGDSAGGNLELVFLDYLRKHGLPMPRAGVTFSAWTDLTATSPSFQSKKRYDAVFGGNHVIHMAAEEYIKDTDKKLEDTDVSPYFMTDFTGFPPMLMQVGSNEMLLSSTVDVAKKMIRSGVDVTLEVYSGMYHEFQRGTQFSYQAKMAWNNVENFVMDIFSG